MNRAIPQWLKVKYWYPIRIVSKGRSDISWFNNPQVMVPRPNHPNLFLIYIERLCSCHTKVKPSILFIISINELNKFHEWLVLIF